MTVTDLIAEALEHKHPDAIVVYLGSDLFAQFMEEHPILLPDAINVLTVRSSRVRIVPDINMPPGSAEFVGVPEKF